MKWRVEQRFGGVWKTISHHNLLWQAEAADRLMDTYASGRIVHHLLKTEDMYE